MGKLQTPQTTIVPKVRYLPINLPWFWLFLPWFSDSLRI